MKKILLNTLKVATMAAGAYIIYKTLQDEKKKDEEFVVETKEEFGDQINEEELREDLDKVSKESLANVMAVTGIIFGCISFVNYLMTLRRDLNEVMLQANSNAIINNHNFNSMHIDGNRAFAEIEKKVISFGGEIV